MNWKNKIVIVAGADSLVGYALCRLLSAQNAIVYGCGQSEEKLSLLADIPTQAISLKDISSLKHWVEKIGNKHGHIDSVFCDTTIEITSINVYNLTSFSVNEALFHTTYYSWKSALYAVPFLKSANQGSIVFITTNDHKHITNNNILPAFCCTSIESMTKNFSSEVACDGIRICTVAADSKALRQNVANCAIFLASKEASYITGTMMEVTL